MLGFPIAAHPVAAPDYLLTGVSIAVGEALVSESAPAAGFYISVHPAGGAITGVTAPVGTHKISVNVLVEALEAVAELVGTQNIDVTANGLLDSVSAPEGGYTITVHVGGSVAGESTPVGASAISVAIGAEAVTSVSELVGEARGGVNKAGVIEALTSPEGTSHVNVNVSGTLVSESDILGPYYKSVLIAAAELLAASAPIGTIQLTGGLSLTGRRPSVKAVFQQGLIATDTQLGVAAVNAHSIEVVSDTSSAKAL